MLDPEVLKQFHCSGCGECCRWTGAVLLEEFDLPRLAVHLGLSEQELIEPQRIISSGWQRDRATTTENKAVIKSFSD